MCRIYLYREIQFREIPLWQNKKSPESGDFGAIFGWTGTVPMGGECAQTGVFLAATGAVCEDGVELVCVQLLYRE